MLLDSNRIQTVITKGGHLRGYSSQFILIPEYDLGIVLLVAGDGRALPWLREEVLKALVPTVEQITRDQTADRLAGTYISADAAINSSLSIEVQSDSGLVVTSWISNGKDFLTNYLAMSKEKRESSNVQLTPAMIGRGKNGEVWRAQCVQAESRSEGIINTNLIEDVDTFTYASRSIDEFIFELDASGRAVEVKLPAFQITLKRKEQAESSRNRFHELMEPLGFHR